MAKSRGSSGGSSGGSSTSSSLPSPWRSNQSDSGLIEKIVRKVVWAVIILILMFAVNWDSVRGGFSCSKTTAMDLVEKIPSPFDPPRPRPGPTTILVTPGMETEIIPTYGRYLEWYNDTPCFVRQFKANGMPLVREPWTDSAGWVWAADSNPRWCKYRQYYAGSIVSGIQFRMPDAVKGSHGVEPIASTIRFTRSVY